MDLHVNTFHPYVLQICVYAKSFSVTESQIEVKSEFNAIPTKQFTQFLTTYNSKAYHSGPELFFHVQYCKKCFVYESPKCMWNYKLKFAIIISKIQLVNTHNHTTYNEYYIEFILLLRIGRCTQCNHTDDTEVRDMHDTKFCLIC